MSTLRAEPPAQSVSPIEALRPDAVAKPKICVVIAAYNARHTIDATLASVAAQSLRPAEVIVADDASTDGTADVARRWERMLPLQVITLERNAGPALARHTAILASRSAELVALIDADDVWLPDHLQVLTDLYARAGGIACARAIRWLPDTGVSVPAPTDFPEPSAQLGAILTANFAFIGALFRIEDYLRTGGFRSGMTGAEDWDLWVRMIRMGSAVSSAPHPTVLYRLSTGSLTAAERTLTSEIGVLERAASEATSDWERRIVARSLRTYRGRRALAEGYSLAREGRSWDARRRALGALRGPRRVALRAAAMLVAPGWAVRIRDTKRFDPGRWLGR